MDTSALALFPADLHSALRNASSMWNDAYNAIKYAERLLFYGPPGTGKSRACSKVELGSRPLERTSITPETCWPEIRGHFGLGANGMDWRDGPGARAWKNGSRWVIDEIDQAGGDTVPGLHMLADDREVARLTLPNGETITPKEDFQMFATTNADPRSLPEALNDRFVVQREILFPDPDILMTLPEELRVAAGYSLYAQKTPGSLNLSTRKWVELGRLMNHHCLDVREALKVLMRKSSDAASAIEVANLKMTPQLAV